MKKLLIILLCCASVAAFAQEQQQIHIYSKVFRLNNYTRYITNMPAVSGLAFFFHEPADTNTMVMYIPDFKMSDIQLFEDKIKMYKSKMCMPNYVSQPGDFIYCFPPEGGIAYYYHPRPGERPAEIQPK